MNKILVIFLIMLSKDSFGLQNMLKAGSDQLLSRGIYTTSRCSQATKRFFSNAPLNDQIPASEVNKEIQVSSRPSIHNRDLLKKEKFDLPSEKKKFVDDLAKYDQKVLNNQSIKEKDWEKNLQEGWRDFTKAAKENPELSSEKFFDDLTKSDQAAKKEDRLEVIQDLTKKMILKRMDPKDVSEITGLSEADILYLKNFGLQNMLKAGSDQLLSPRPLIHNRDLLKKEKFDLPSEKKKFIDDLAKYDQKVLNNQSIKEKDWKKNLQEGWRDFTKAAKENPELSSEKFFDDLTKSDQAAKKEDRLEVIQDLTKKMILKGMDPKDISEITGLSKADILYLKNKG